MKKSYLTRLACLTLGIVSLSACQQNELPQAITPATTVRAAKTLRAQLGAEVTPIQYDQANQASPKSLGIAFDETHPKYLPQLALEGSSFQTIVYLRKQGSTDPADFFHIVLQDAQWKEKQLLAGKIHLSTHDASSSAVSSPLTIPAGKNEPQAGETWEVAAILGENDSPFSVPGIQGSGDGVFWMQGPRIAVASSEDEDTGALPKVTMNIPYYSSWQAFKVDADGTLKANFSFRCVGSLIHYRLDRELIPQETSGPQMPPLPGEKVYRGGVLRPELVFSTNLGTLFGACEFRQGDDDFHWIGLDRTRLANDPNFVAKPWLTSEDATGYSIPAFGINGTAPAHILIFVVPMATPPTGPLTTLKRHPQGAPTPALRRAGDAHQGATNYYGERVNSNLPEAVRGKVHFGRIVARMNFGAPQ